MTLHRMAFIALSCFTLAGGSLAQSASSQLNDTLPTTPPNHTGSANTNNPASTSETKPGVGLIEGLNPKTSGSSDVSALDRAFAEQASRYGAAQVAAGQLALKQSRNPKVTEYAHRAVDNGEGVVGQLNKLTGALKINVANTDGRAIDETRRLKAAEGTVFDGLYGQLQLTDQKEALALYQKEEDSGENTQLKGYAATMKQNVGVMLKHAEAVANGTLDKKNPNCPANAPARTECP